MHKVLVASREEAQVAEGALGSLANLIQDAEHRKLVGTELQGPLSAPNDVGDFEAV